MGLRGTPSPGALHVRGLVNSPAIVWADEPTGNLDMTLSYNLVAEIRKDIEGFEFSVPWAKLLMVVSIAYGASLLTTFLPARQAARVYPAEAMRFE